MIKEALMALTIGAVALSAGYAIAQDDDLERLEMEFERKQERLADRQKTFELIKRLHELKAEQERLQLERDCKQYAALKPVYDLMQEANGLIGAEPYKKSESEKQLEKICSGLKVEDTVSVSEDYDETKLFGRRMVFDGQLAKNLGITKEDMCQTEQCWLDGLHSKNALKSRQKAGASLNYYCAFGEKYNDKGMQNYCRTFCKTKNLPQFEKACYSHRKAGKK